MRRPARELSITPVALYHHVHDRDQLPRLLLETRRPARSADPRLTARSDVFRVGPGDVQNLPRRIGDSERAGQDNRADDAPALWHFRV
ncbi:hypothetical protein [Streptomyces botrytidirepellens]|uniref:Uncharacterized protein n=1 Tax=Streptomyces botrytidirepellens TaxID=2486417 RepID=A0A3M8W6E3_9ACTN|nr:hypothetical protein [Streptomyces botrytidirepellens]RNG25140.1 hypothetical protein EEJ42_16675 [Streptomyces botrytidirepellens]